MSDKAVTKQELVEILRENNREITADLSRQIQKNTEQIKSEVSLQIDGLARMVKEGFDEINERFDRLEARVSRLEEQVVTIKGDLRIVKEDVENIKLRMTSLAPNFEVQALHRRVMKVEVKVEQMEQREMERLENAKKK